MKSTKGPWYLIADNGADFTAIATVPKIEGHLDTDKEVLGSSEWLRVERADLVLMTAAPELLEALKSVYCECSELYPHDKNCFMIKVEKIIEKATTVLEECEECKKSTEIHEDGLCEECYYHFHCECGNRLEDSYGSPGDGLCRACD